MTGAPVRTGAGRFPRSARLLGARDFDQVFRLGRVLTIGVFRVHYLPTDAGPRLGLAIARKALPRAVDRNRLKRQLREGFRVRRALLPSLDLVIRVQAGVRKLDRPERQAQLAELWQRIATLVPTRPPPTALRQRP